MNVLCSAIQVALPTVGGLSMAGPLTVHVESCEACRYEVAAYRNMHHGLAALEESVYRSPADLTRNVMSHLGPVAVEDDRRRRDNLVPVAAAAVVATAAAGTAVLIKVYRSRAA